MGNIFSTESEMSPMMLILLIGAIALLGIGLYYMFADDDKPAVGGSTFVGASSLTGGAKRKTRKRTGKKKATKRKGKKRTTKRKGRRKMKGGLVTGTTVTRM